jgi:2-dehydropantoate 2-reductase
MNNSPVILVIGAGAIGGIVAGILKRKGFDVCLVTKHPDLAKEISEKGLEISGNCGNFTIKVPSVAEVTQISRRPTIVLIATKALDMPHAAIDVLPLLCEISTVVSLRNGIVEEELGSIVGAERTVGCVVGWGATMHSKTKLEMTSSGEFVIGYIDKKQDEKLKELAKILENILPVEISDNILPNLYSKLIINSCITTVGAISGLPLGLQRSIFRYNQGSN